MEVKREMKRQSDGRVERGRRSRSHMTSLKRFVASGRLSARWLASHLAEPSEGRASSAGTGDTMWEDVSCP